MAQIPASYTRNRDRAIPGQIADTTLYQIDGACVVDDDGANIPNGRFVSLLSVEPVQGHKVVALGAPASSVPFGVSVLSHARSPAGYYEPAVAINVMRQGTIWVEADSALTEAQAAFGNAVTYDANGIVANGAANAAANARFTGEILPAANGKRLVKILLVL